MATQMIHHPLTTYAATMIGRSPASILAEEGIREACERVADAWSHGDAAMLSAVLAPDCDHMTLTRVRHVKRGRAALVGSWDEAFTRRDAGFTLRMTVAVQSVRLLNDELALVDGTFEYSDGIGAGGVGQGRSSQPFSALMTSGDLHWVFLSVRVGPATAAAKVIPCEEDLSPR